MGTTDGNGIFFYETTDPVSPLQTLLNLGQQSVSNALTANVRIWPVADSTARNALAGVRIPSASQPLVVYRQDTFVYEMSTSGTNFRAIAFPTLYGEATGPGGGRTVANATLVDMGTQTLGTNIGGLLTASGTTGSNPGVLVSTAGVYSIHQYITYGGSAASGRSFVQLLVNGTVVARQVMSGEEIGSVGVPAIALAAGDKITAQAFQSTGGGVTMNSQIRIVQVRPL